MLTFCKQVRFLNPCWVGELFAGNFQNRVCSNKLINHIKKLKKKIWWFGHHLCVQWHENNKALIFNHDILLSRVRSRVRHETSEEDRKTHRLKRCEYNNEDEDNSPNTLNDENHQASSQKFRQIIFTQSSITVGAPSWCFCISTLNWSMSNQ